MVVETQLPPTILSVSCEIPADGRAMLFLLVFVAKQDTTAPILFTCVLREQHPLTGAGSAPKSPSLAC